MITTMSNTFKDKQEWLEAVMASDLSAGTKVYAFGVYKHMYGNKMDSFPGAKAISEATGLATGKFYLHNRALKDAGFLEVTHRSGRSNIYTLAYPPTEEVGTHPQKGYHPPTEVVTPTHKRGTNTTKNPTSKTTTESNNNTPTPDGPVVDDSPNNEVKEGYEYLGSLEVSQFADLSLTWETASYDYLANKEGVAAFDALPKVKECRTAPQAQPNKMYPLSAPARKSFDQMMKVHHATEEQAAEALKNIQSRPQPSDLYEAVLDALRAAGVVVTEAW